jgi:hypothetical protein
MSVNPYESPRVGDAPARQPLSDSDSIRQLLTEIRDQQAELLALHRATLQRQKRWAFLPILIVPLMVGLPLYRLWTLPRPTLPRPIRTAPATAPLIPAQPAPSAS